LGRRNCGALSPNEVSNDNVMNQGSADEAVVVIKLSAEEGYGDIPEDKTPRKWQEAEAKGGT